MTHFNLRAVASSAVFVSLAVLGIVSPAIAGDHTIWLQEGEESTVTGYFLEGESIYAECDKDCEDLDLYLYTELGVLVDSDEALDAFPIVVAPYEGTFSIETVMPSCKHTAGCSVSISSDYGF